MGWGGFAEHPDAAWASGLQQGEGWSSPGDAALGWSLGADEGEGWEDGSGTDWRDGGAWSGPWWGPESQSAGYGWQPSAPSRPLITSADEHTARLHLKKTYQVLSEVLAAHPKAFQEVHSFLDLGCAPGGFAARLLEEKPMARGYGVTMPVEGGGFPMLFQHQWFQVQGCNLMDLWGPDDLLCQEEVDVCMADAQDLGRRTNPDAVKAEKARKGGTSAVGVGAVCPALGIFALTFQELRLGLSRLRSGGTLLFRFGWRGKGANEELWYKEATTLLLAFILSHFNEVIPFKSEFSHNADATFYMVASGFLQEDFAREGLVERLREAMDYIVQCENVDDLPWCMETLQPYATEEMRAKADEMLETVGRLRAIGLASRHKVEGPRENPEAALWISPVPFSLTMQRLRERLERYGKISFIRRRAHAIGVGADALIQFTQPAHASAALEAIQQLKVLGESVAARRFSDIKTK